MCGADAGAGISDEFAASTAYGGDGGDGDDARDDDDEDVTPFPVALPLPLGTCNG